MGGYGGTSQEVSGVPLRRLRGYLVRGFLGTCLRGMRVWRDGGKRGNHLGRLGGWEHTQGTNMDDKWGEWRGTLGGK